ncbi:MAG TPA: response regulator [Candidatus Binatia bacterium]|nr:response regulator [Candidatus Binatia bacterium]
MRTRLVVHVDDDEAMGFLFGRALRAVGLVEWSVKYLSSGRLALDYLTQVKEGGVPKPDLLVLDLRMPGTDGFDVLEWATATVPEIPAVMLSSSDLLSDRLRARDLGSKGYFVKAPGFADLFEFLRTWDETAVAGIARSSAAPRDCEPIRRCA